MRAVLALKNAVSAAKQSRDRNREAYDRQLAEDSAPTLRDAVFADSYEEREVALGKLDGTRASYRTKAGVAAFDERVSKARDAAEIRGMRAAYDVLMGEQDTSNVAGLRAALDNFKHHVDATQNEAAKEFGMKLLSGIGRQYDRRTSALVSDLLVAAQYGYDPKTGEPYSVEKLMEDFQGASQYFDPKQAAEFSKAVRDRIQMDGKDIPTQEELALAFQAIGVERDKVPSLFAETDGLFVYDPKEGWRTDPARWKAWDERTGKKDDIVDLNDRYYSSDERNVTREAVDEIMRTMREYRIARYLDGGKNKDLLDNYLQRLRNSRQRLDSMRIVEASREAWNDFHRVGSFQAVGAFPWRSPDDPAWGDEEGEE